MIRSFKLKAGPTSESSPLEVTTSPVTVFVGPNNSGKSRVLAEMSQRCREGHRIQGEVVLDDLVFNNLDEALADAEIDSIRQAPHADEVLHVDHVLVGSRYGRVQVPLQQLRSAIGNPSSNPSGFAQWFLRHKTLMLDGSSRIQLVNDQSGGDLQQAPQTSFQVLFRDDAKRHEVRRIIFEAFGEHFVIDPTNLGSLRARLSSRSPNSDLEERGVHAEAVTFHAQARPITAASDGVKAFAGIVTELMAGDPKVFFIDEPEAFLHPALASKLGSEISSAAVASSKRVFVSTHSPSFLMGCIQSGATIDIVRLTYRGGSATARHLPSSEILELMRNPLLRSTGVLSGLFYEFVVVTESDADRAFYQEINERLLRFRPEWGIPNCLFLNAQNKQTVHTILRPLRKLGIPAVGIVDIDVLKEGGAVWGNLMDGAVVPPITATSLGSMRSAVLQAMTATGRNMKRDGGLDILAGQARLAAEDLLKQLASYGIFVVPGGELESWVSSLDATGHGPAWLVDVFTKMGEDPGSGSYLKPDADDVWAFMGAVKGWLFDAGRKGIPQ